jgi:NADH dehydrogenase [ubiquinone] 1 alpha subcomplex assembly factor 5
MRQQRRLVEAAVPKPPARQRNGHDEVGVDQEWPTRLHEPAAEKPGDIVPVAEFQVMHQGAHDAVKARDSPGAVVVGRGGGGSRRDHGAPGIVGHRQPEPVAQRRRDEIDPGPAFGAQRIVRRKRGVTAKAERRHDQVGDDCQCPGQGPPGLLSTCEHLSHAPKLANDVHRRHVSLCATPPRAAPDCTGRQPLPPPSPDETRIFDRALLARRRDRIAAGAGGHDFLLQRVADDIAERLAMVQRTFPLAVDLGAHHGVVSQRIAGMAGIERIIDVDASAALLAQCAGLKVVADEEALPFAPASVDLVVSGLALQSVNDLPGALVQVRRALKPDGLLLAALLGGETLKELRHAWLAAEAELMGGASPRVAPFADVRELGALLQRAGFALPVVDSETLTVTYASPFALMQEIKAMGGSNALVARGRRPVTRRLLARAADIYTERFAQADGRVPATFEILTLTAWAPDESQPKPLQPGSAKVRLADALGVAERKLRE